MSAQEQFVGTKLILLPLELETKGVEIDPDHLCDDPMVTKKPIEDEHHLTLAIGVPGDADLQFVNELTAKIPPFVLTFSKLDCFETRNKSWGSPPQEHSWDVLILKADCEDQVKSLHQQIYDHYNMKWHFPTYHPHATLAYLKPGVARAHYLSTMKEPLVARCNHVEIRTYKDRTGVPIVFPMGRSVPSNVAEN